MYIHPYILRGPQRLQLIPANGTQLKCVSAWGRSRWVGFLHQYSVCDWLPGSFTMSWSCLLIHPHCLPNRQNLIIYVRGPAHGRGLRGVPAINFRLLYLLHIVSPTQQNGVRGAPGTFLESPARSRTGSAGYGGPWKILLEVQWL